MTAKKKADEKTEKVVPMHLSLWESVEKTNPKHTKKVEYGKRKYTSINPQSQVERATQLWGKMGDTWGMRNIRFDLDLRVYTSDNTRFIKQSSVK